VLRKKLTLLVAMALMLAMMAMSVAPAFAAPDKNDPAGHSCGLNDPNAYKAGGEYDEGLPGVGELRLEYNSPIGYGCAPGK
jgi:hypothetical protein